MQPYDTINDVGFWYTITTFHPKYTPPDQKLYNLQMFDSNTTRIQQQISQEEYLAMLQALVLPHIFKGNK